MNRNRAKSGNFVPPEKLAEGSLLRVAGMHEAGVSTDAYTFFHGAEDLGKGNHMLPLDVPKSSFFYQYRGKVVSSSRLQMLMDVADGFRLSTVRTILSGPGGTAAGHVGSDIDAKGQPFAHDLVRAAIMRILKKPADRKGISKRSVTYLLGAIVVASTAPGELARTVEGGTSGLHYDPAKATYEQDRNEMKARVESFRGQLTEEEKAFADGEAQKFMSSLQRGVSPKRYIPTLRATSPEREAAQPVPNEVSGGDYRPGHSTLKPQKPQKSPPANQALGPQYITEPGRIPAKERGRTPGTQANLLSS